MAEAAISVSPVLDLKTPEKSWKRDAAVWFVEISTKVRSRACAVMKITTKSSQIDCDWLLALGITSTYLIHFLFHPVPQFLWLRACRWHVASNVACHVIFGNFSHVVITQNKSGRIVYRQRDWTCRNYSWSHKKGLKAQRGYSFNLKNDFYN